MGLSQEINRRIRSKEAEVEGIEEEILQLRMKLEAAKAYIQGLQDILPKAEKENDSTIGQQPKSSELRPGTLMAQARDVIAAAGKPLHLIPLLQAMGKDNTAKNRLSLGGSLARCVREGTTFTRPAPNTFGLKTFDSTPKSSTEELPLGFGK